MNSENVDTEPSADAQATLCPFLRGVGVWGVRQGTLFLEGVGYTLHKGQLTRIIQKELQSLIKYFVRS